MGDDMWSEDVLITQRVPDPDRVVVGPESSKIDPECSSLESNTNDNIPETTAEQSTYNGAESGATPKQIVDNSRPFI